MKTQYWYYKGSDIIGEEKKKIKDKDKRQRGREGEEEGRSNSIV